MPASDDQRPRRILPVIVLSQFAGSSIWFAGNAVLPDLTLAWGLGTAALSSLTSAVQLGFIFGTLSFALLGIADRFPPQRVFLVCALGGSAANALVVFLPGQLDLFLALRFATGFLLAGIYPVGMKIAGSWYAGGLGRALGYLVGALVLGTALPHLIRSLGTDLPWEGVMITVSGVAALGGVAMAFLVPSGPHLPKRSAFRPKALAAVFTTPETRAAALGYFGHMWELYAFWAFVPLVLAAAFSRHNLGLDVSFWSFAVIAAGAIGCMGGGVVSRYWGSARVAALQLALSGLCCLAAPWLDALPLVLFLAVMLVWGVTVAGDSPQFSTLAALTAPKAQVGSILTLINSIGFSITVIAIQGLGFAAEYWGPQAALAILAPGPLLGLLGLRPLIRRGL
ncbi:MAG: MFS transporter [Rhodospirillales bacterium]